MPHTPGPWRIADDATIYWRAALEIECDEGTIAVTTRGFEEGPSWANARLIAAAPDLLAALQGILAITDRKHFVWDKAHAAINKALGET